MSKRNKAIAVVGAALIGAAGLLGGYAMAPDQINCPNIDVEAIQELAFKDGVNSVVLPEPVVVVENNTIYEEVLVDNGDLGLVLSYLEDKEIFEDADEIVEDIKKEDSALKLAVAELKKEFADELEDAELVGDEDDVDLIKVYDDLDDYELLSADYEDEEFVFKIGAKVEDEEEDEKFKVFFEIEVEDGEAKIVDLYKDE